jgi:hypothetical protein
LLPQVYDELRKLALANALRRLPANLPAIIIGFMNEVTRFLNAARHVTSATQAERPRTQGRRS